LEKRQAQEAIEHLKAQLESKENFEIESKLLIEVKKLKEELYHSRMNEAKLKLKIAEFQKKGRLIRSKCSEVEQGTGDESILCQKQLEAVQSDL
jgi:hypothetical protein